MNFIDKNEFECPYCHKQLEDKAVNGIDYKICNNKECTTTNNVWVMADFGSLHY